MDIELAKVLSKNIAIKENEFVDLNQLKEIFNKLFGCIKPMYCPEGNKIYHLIKNLQKVSGFLGSEDKPTPISDSEIKRILGQVSESAVNQKSGISFEIGEKVKVCDGPFASFNGEIDQTVFLESYGAVKVEWN